MGKMGDKMVRSSAILTILISLFVTGCSKNDLDSHLRSFSDNVESWEKQKDVAAVDKAKAAYQNGDYGNAEKHYRAAVEANPKNPDAWLGLAATYDRLKRFENANNAYDVVIKLVDYTPAVLNNLGYHYMLRGEFAHARKTLRAALKLDPGNPYIKNNMDKLVAYEKKVKKK